MSASEEKKSLFEMILGGKLELSNPYESLLQNSPSLEIISDDLYCDLQSFFDKEAPFFITSLPLDRIVRYRDGSYSSMSKSARNSIGGHKGYEIVSGFDIANKFMYYAMPRLKAKLASVYSDLILENQYHIDLLNNNLTIPNVSLLKSIADYTQQIVEDIEDIAKSVELTTSTLTNLQAQRIKLRTVFYTHIEHLNNSIRGISYNYNQNNGCNNFIDEKNIADNYLLARHSLSYFIVSQVLEQIISGNLDESSVGKLKKRAKKCFDDLNSITQQVAQALKYKIQINSSEIYSINNCYRWSFDQYVNGRLGSLYGQNNSMQGIIETKLKQFDIDHEMQRLDEFINSRHSLVARIEVKKLKE